MESKTLISLLVLVFWSSLAISQKTVEYEESNSKNYIVLLQKPKAAHFKTPKDLDIWYRSFLPQNFPSSRLIHSYHNLVTGFSVKLTAQQAMAMKMKKEVLLARPERMVSLYTTHTPALLGLQQNSGFWQSSNYGKGVIIGCVDSGITPDHPSFLDEGMPPPPAKWKGICQLVGASCNNKLIGVRIFDSTTNSASDTVGHGTHVAATAVGSPVQGASFFGQANGTATGIAPLAHLAMYKVSGRSNNAGESEVLAAMDAAVGDGVDVLSLSLGTGPHPFYDDVIAIGAYAATQKGIFVSCAAGNSGPNSASVENGAPWILTVGASTVDRTIRATVLLGNNVELNGESLYQPTNFSSTLFPLVYPGANGNPATRLCLSGSLSNFDVKGKIVLCEGGSDTISKGQEVKNNGGAAMIVMNTVSAGFITQPSYHVLPASHVSYLAGTAIKDYIKSATSPTATILFKGTIVGVTDAPQVAMFSSRGPNTASPGILKPDIIGPGVYVVAAYPVSVDNTINRFEMLSGTSMACPHLSGIAALLKSAHPDWSPAAIKSAIMTTADLHNLGGKPISDQQFVPANVFDMGAGHANPSRANNPGLVYDIHTDDYIRYLCGLGYSDNNVGIITQTTVKCSNISRIPEAQLNYPAFSIKLGSTPQTYTRTLTNYGNPNSTYNLEIFGPQGVNVMVTPNKISFNDAIKNAIYSVTFSKNENAGTSGSFAQGYLNWMDDGHSVRSPIAVMF